MGDDRALIVRLNARIANQREEIKHKQFVLEQLERRASQVARLLGTDPAQPIMDQLAQVIAERAA
jgi:hypothetical protein